MADINELIELEKISFKPEAKDDYARIRISKKQKMVLKMMAKERNMTVTELIMRLLQYEKETNVIFNKVLEEDVEG